MDWRSLVWSAILVCVVAAAHGCSDAPAATAGVMGGPAGQSGAGTPAPSVAGMTGSAGRTTGSSSGTGGSSGGAAASAGRAAGSGGAVAGGGAGAVAGATAAAGMAGAVAGMAAQSGGAGATMPPADDSCDRMCLLAVMQSYLDALVAKDPSKLKVASTLKYTENGVASKLGETLWKTVTGIMPMARLDYADPMLGNVGTQTVVNEGSAPVLYMVRLKVVKHEITEIETMAVRRQGAANGFFNAANLVPEKVFLQPIDPAKRMTRDELNALTEVYLDYLEGKKRGNVVPFDTGCKRYENGQVTASGTSSFNSQSWSFQVTRRILVIDEEAGITWGMFPFTQAANSLVVGEAFKMIEGKIMMIQAVMANQPAKVWE